MDVRQAIEAAGGIDAVATRVGVVPGQVRNKIFDGALPAAWYAAMSDLAGEDLPRSLFTFKGLAAE